MSKLEVIREPKQTAPPSASSNSEIWSIQGCSDTFEIELQPYKGIDFSKIGFMFCGQGQMTPGAMFDIINKNPFVIARLKELDSIVANTKLGTPSDYILEPQKPIPLGSEAFYSYSCLYTLQVAMFESMIATGYFPNILTAHSFGEFAQLTASGVVSFSDMIHFFVDRHSVLQEVEGTFIMFAVNNSQKVSLKEIPFEIYKANVNTNFQSTYVCKEKDYEKIRLKLRELRIACVKVPLDSPFHTPWLKQAKEKLLEKLQQRDIHFSVPKIPFVSSVTGQMIDKTSFEANTIKNIMADQLVAPVNFPRQVDFLLDTGIHHYFELSPSDVLSPFVEQICELKEMPVKVNSFRKHFKVGAQTNKTYDKFKKSKMFSTLDTVLKSLTGYSIQNIKLEDRIREDLGIDSIKKAEIVFEIMDSLEKSQVVTPANLSDLSTFGDILEYFETTRIASDKSEKEADENKEVIFSSMIKTWKKRPLNDFASYSSPSINFISLSELRKETSLKSSPTDLLVFRDDLQHAPTEEDNFVQEFKYWLSYFQENEPRSNRWIFLHSGSRFSRCFDAFLTTYAQEQKASYKSIETASTFELNDYQLHLESLDFYDTKVRYDDQKRFVRNFEEFDTYDTVRPAKNVLVFGGMGGIGYQQVLELTKTSTDVMIIFGRRPIDENLQQKLEQLPVKPKHLEYIELDVENRSATENKISELFAAHGHFDLAIHSVGFETSDLLENLSLDEIDKILRGKISLAECLCETSKNYPSLKVIFNSSIASEFGNKGQTPYVMANTYLNQLADESTNITSILWPGWEEVGVAAQTVNAKALKLQGVALMSIDNGMSIFRKCLSSDQKNVLCLAPGSLLSYASVGQSLHEFDDLMKPASKDYSLFVLSGLTQNQQPYLKDHIVKKSCIFPASGSMALMLFRAYLERGELGTLKNFTGHNFLMVAPDSSNATLQLVERSEEKMSFQTRSFQLLTSGDVVFGQSWNEPQETYSFECDYIGQTDFDSNVAVYTGPTFELTDRSYINSESGEVMLEVDFTKAPVYFKNEILDKLHRLLELSFSASFAKIWLDEGKQTIPKSIDEVQFHENEFYGQRFYSLIRSFRIENGFCYGDVVTLNEKGRPAVKIKNLRMIIIGSNENTRERGFKLTPHKHRIF